MKVTGTLEKLAIYFFFDSKGVVDEYVTCFLDDLKKNVKDILIVSNGSPTEEGCKILRSYGDLFVRENTGFDVWAYKEGLEYIGWDRLESYDEVIMVNSTIMGPVYPLKETFDKMDSQDVDFWGITMYFTQPWDPSGCCRYGYIPDHIQSHWIACRRSLVQSEEFHKYWEEMPMITTYWEAVGKHEMIFTKHFEDLGFKKGLSVDMEDLRTYNSYPLMMCPTKIVKEKRCPIFKRRMFFHDPRDFMSQTSGEQVQQFWEFLKNETQYDTNMIWETVLRHYHMVDIVKNMSLNYVFPEQLSDEMTYQQTIKKNRVALIYYLKHEEILEESLEYAKCMPPETDVYLVTESDEVKEKSLHVFEKLHCHHLEARRIEAGGDVAALLIGVRDVIMNYDLACVMQDMEGYQNSVAYGYVYRCIKSMLASPSFVKNVIVAFEQHPRMGFLAPPVPNHGPFFTNLGKEWREYYPKVTALMDELHIDVPVALDKPPVTSLETLFWFRPNALQSLYEKQWTYEEFQKDAETDNGALSAVIERIYPFAVQQAGYYAGTVMSDKIASIELGNLNYYVREYNTALMEHKIENYQQYMYQDLKKKLESEEYLTVERERLERRLQAFADAGLDVDNLSLKNAIRCWVDKKKRNWEKK